MDTIVSGMRPTGRLHIGHLHGALDNWVRLQHDYRCYFFVADWHALTTGNVGAGGIRESTEEMAIDWLSAGLDPERAVIFRQSDVKEHAELHLLFSMITPTPWLLRNPTVKEQARELGIIQSEDESEVTKINYGLLGYPVLQAADILIYKARRVPVGVDQVPHIEITREIARRFNSLCGEVFPEPQPLLTDIPKIPGVDGRKMSKSYGNAVFLSDSPAEIDQKLSRMVTDPARVRRNDPGEPEKCPAFQLHKVYSTEDEIEEVSKGCRTAGIGCLNCKKIMIKHVLEEVAPMRERRAQFAGKPRAVREILLAGDERARKAAGKTMSQVREALGL